MLRNQFIWRVVTGFLTITSVARGIDPLAPVTYDSQGAAQVSSTAQNAMASGAVPPGVQLALIQNLLQECVSRLLAEGPTQRTPYKTAYQQFVNMNCVLARCFQKTLALDFYAQSSSNVKNGGTSNPQEAAMYQTTAKTIEAQMAKSGCGQQPQQ